MKPKYQMKDVLYHALKILLNKLFALRDVQLYMCNCCLTVFCVHAC
jgi:hypothetical protein